MDNVEKDNVIIQKARDYLDNRSQPYIEGAWEDFVEFRRKRKRRRICLKYGIGAAACLSALFITFRAFQPEGSPFNRTEKRRFLLLLQNHTYLPALLARISVG